MHLEKMEYTSSDTNKSCYNLISAISPPEKPAGKIITNDTIESDDKNMPINGGVKMGSQKNRKISKIPVRQRVKTSGKPIENARNKENDVHTVPKSGNGGVSIGSVENVSTQSRLHKQHCEAPTKKHHSKTHNSSPVNHNRAATSSDKNPPTNTETAANTCNNSLQTSTISETVLPILEAPEEFRSSFHCNNIENGEKIAKSDSYEVIFDETSRQITGGDARLQKSNGTLTNSGYCYFVMDETSENLHKSDCFNYSISDNYVRSDIHFDQDTNICDEPVYQSVNKINIVTPHNELLFEHCRNIVGEPDIHSNTSEVAPVTISETPNRELCGQQWPIHAFSGEMYQFNTNKNEIVESDASSDTTITGESTNEMTVSDCCDVGDLNGQIKAAEGPEGSVLDAAYREVERPAETRGTTISENRLQSRTDQESTPARAIKPIQSAAKDLTVTQPCVQYHSESRDEDNDHVQQQKQQHDSNNGIVTERHVGSTTPPGDTPQQNRVVMAPIIAEEVSGGGTLTSETETKKCYYCGSVSSVECVKCSVVIRKEVLVDESAVAAVDVGLCAGRPQTPPTMGPSIQSGVSQCARAPGCSRDSAAKVCATALDREPTAHTSYCTDTLVINNAENDRKNNTGDCLSTTDQHTANSSHLTSDKNNVIDTVSKNINKTSSGANTEVLCWSFKNGRLVFDVALKQSESVLENQQDNNSRLSSEQVVDIKETYNKVNSENSLGFCTKDADALKSDAEILSSKTLNKRRGEDKSRIKYVGLKLKEAGLVDGNIIGTPKYTDYKDFIENTTAKSGIKTATGANYDANQNIVNNYHETIKQQDNGDEDIIPEGSDTVDFTGNICEFDVRQVAGFPGFNANYEVYDELENNDECSSSDDDDENYILLNKRNMRGDGGGNMVSDSDRAKHNPDRDNLKSLLKKPGKSKDNKKSNRVVFNENKNEFFDADYIILIREECDYDDDDDDSVCTCNQHEMVRLTCCEPNCNCNAYSDGYDQTPQSPKFAPPIEFVDAVTLSPPEGYKDMELGEQQLLALQQMSRARAQRTAVCRECSASHEDDIDEDGDGSQSDTETADCSQDQHKIQQQQEEKEKTDQSQQTTPTTPPNDLESPSSQQRYIMETITMTTVKQQQILREAEDGGEEKVSAKCPQPGGGSPISGILKGGRLWKQQSSEISGVRSGENLLMASDSITSDDESGNRRSVRFIETNKEKRDVCDGAPESSPEETDAKDALHISKTEPSLKTNDSSVISTSPDATEMMLTFKLGNHVLISNNSLKPNSAVRQLFPCTKPLGGNSEEESLQQQYLVTAESLRAFEEAKRSKLPQIIQSGETDESIKRAIERNTLRRSLIRYEPRTKKAPYKTDNSLVERIKQLTCDVDDQQEMQQHQDSKENDLSEDIQDSRVSPPGEEARNSPEVSHVINKSQLDKSFSPSSSSTASSSSSSMSSNYNRKPTEVLEKRGDHMPDIQNNYRRELKPLPDIGGPHTQEAIDLNLSRQPMHDVPDLSHCAMSKLTSTTDSRRQFLATLAPLTACVSMGMVNAGTDEYHYHLSNQPGERASMASSAGTEYSLEDIDEGLKNDQEEEQKRIAPDVLAGTPSASESGDELAMFVQQDAGRIERIKKKYQPEQAQNKDEDDEHDDYGFNRRPSVRGIKPRFGSTTEILQQIQNQLQPPVPSSRVAWPYYSESGVSAPVDNSNITNAKPLLPQRNMNQNVPNYNQYVNVPEDVKARGFSPQYRPTSLQDENLYQNCTNQRCSSREVYRSNVNMYSLVRVGGNCSTDYYQSLPRPRSGRPQSPPPLEMSKSYHQTMVYIPYNHIEGYQPQVPYYHSTSSADYVRVSSQNQINKRYIEPIYQQRVHHVEEHHYNNPNMLPPMPPKLMTRMSYPNGQPLQHMMTSSRSGSPLPGQFSTARSTQTPVMNTSSAGYYQNNPRYRPMVGPVYQGEGNYVTKMNRHSFPAAGPRYPMPDNISLTDSDSTHSSQMPNGYNRQSADLSGYGLHTKDSMPGSPTKTRFIERGVPEGAASVSPQDAMVCGQSNSSTMTSPTSPQNPAPTGTSKPLFYAMNV